MISFIVAIVVLIFGFLVYGRLTSKIFSPDDRTTPAVSINDGVDCIPMKTWKAVLIQLLNIAGTGPIFGALMGACFGPVVFLWIVFGAILGGAVHDYMTGMISERNGGASIAELSGKYLGKPVLYIMRVFSVLLLLLTGTVFITSPAALIAKLTPSFLPQTFWIIVILIYYVLATLLPIDKVIGKLYPVFGVILIIMAVSIAGDQVMSLSTLMALKKHLESLEKYRKRTIERGGITYELHSVGTPFGLSFKEEYFPVAEDDPVKFLLIALLGGVFGAHKFVAGQWAAGFFYLLTCGGFAIFHGFDVLSIVSGTYYIKQISYTEDEDTVRRITERIYLKKPPRWASVLGIIGLIIPTGFAFLLYIKVFIPTLTYIGSLLLGAL